MTFFVALLALEARREDRLAQGGRFLGLISARKDQCIGKNPPELVELSVKDPSTANNEFEEKDAPQALKVIPVHFISIQHLDTVSRAASGCVGSSCTKY